MKKNKNIKKIIVTGLVIGILCGCSQVKMVGLSRVHRGHLSIIGESERVF